MASSPLLNPRDQTRKPGWTVFGSRLTLLATLTSVVALLWVYARTGTSVYLEIDGRSWHTQTHQSTVAALLREIGLVLRDEDVVLPAMASPLFSDQTVTVRRARQVQVDADGDLITRLSHARTIGQVLMETGLAIGAHDVITIDGGMVSVDTELPHQTWEPRQWPLVSVALRSQKPSPSAVRIRLQRAVPLFIRDGSVETMVYSVARTVGEELLKQGVVLYLGDRVQPMLGSLLSSGMNVEVERAMLEPAAAQGGGEFPTFPNHRHEPRVGAREGGLVVGRTRHHGAAQDGVLRQRGIHLARHESFKAHDGAVLHPGPLGVGARQSDQQARRCAAFVGQVLQHTGDLGLLAAHHVRHTRRVARRNPAARESATDERGARLRVGTGCR